MLFNFLKVLSILDPFYMSHVIAAAPHLIREGREEDEKSIGKGKTRAGIPKSTRDGNEMHQKCLCLVQRGRRPGINPLRTDVAKR